MFRGKDPGLLRVTGYIGSAAVAALWIFRERIGVSSSALCILTGIALFNFVMQLQNRNDTKKIQSLSETIEENKNSKDNFIGGK